MKYTTANSYTNLTKAVFLQQCITCFPSWMWALFFLQAARIRKTKHLHNISQIMTLYEQCSFTNCEYLSHSLCQNECVNCIIFNYTFIHFIIIYFCSLISEDFKNWSEQPESLLEPQHGCPCSIYAHRRIIYLYTIFFKIYIFQINPVI